MIRSFFAKSILIIILSVIFLGCQDELDIDLGAHRWKVTKIKRADESFYTKAHADYIMEFVSDTIYTINFDVNDCGGKYRKFDNGQLVIEQLYCTEVCCDSDYAEDVQSILGSVTHYHGEGNQLILEGDGEVVLKRD